jgi:hypothetical protein
MGVVGFSVADKYVQLRRLVCLPIGLGLCARIRKAGEMAATLRMALDLEVA